MQSITYRIVYNTQLYIRNSRLCSRKKMPLFKQILNFKKYSFKNYLSLIIVLISLVFTGNAVSLNQWPSNIQTSFFIKPDFQHQSFWLHFFVTCMYHASIFLPFIIVFLGLRRLSFRFLLHRNLKCILRNMTCGR